MKQRLANKLGIYIGDDLNNENESVPELRELRIIDGNYDAIRDEEKAHEKKLSKELEKYGLSMPTTQWIKRGQKRGKR